MYITKNSLINEYSSDCQLVTAINAYYHLTGKIIEHDSNEYQELAELAGCVYGSCINIKKVWDKLGICKDERYSNPFDISDNLKENCFIEVNIWHKHYGFHSIAIVDYIEKAKCVKVTNFKYVSSTEGWIFFEDLKPYIIRNPDHEKPYWCGRTFKLKK